MSEKNITSRIVHKHDTETNWSKATSFIPKQGELIIYDIDETHDYERFKIGDGTQNVNALPFATDNVKLDIDDALSSTSTNPVQNKVINEAINNLNNMLQSIVPKVMTISLLVSDWEGASSPYYQIITSDYFTANSMVDLQPTPEQLVTWQDDGLAFATQNDNGTVKVFVAGGLPNADITVQIKVQEVIVV